jgi:Flp pilus assembly pilin Flp
MLSLFAFVHAALVRLRRDDRGQTTAEYALVLLGAAAVALTLLAWATKTGKITALFDAVVDQVLSKL